MCDWWACQIFYRSCAIAWTRVFSTAVARLCVSVEFAIRQFFWVARCCCFTSDSFTRSVDAFIRESDTRKLMDSTRMSAESLTSYDRDSVRSTAKRRWWRDFDPSSVLYKRSLWPCATRDQVHSAVVRRSVKWTKEIESGRCLEAVLCAMLGSTYGELPVGESFRRHHTSRLLRERCLHGFCGELQKAWQ